METFKIDVDSDGVALVTFDVPGRSMNTITAKVMAELPQVVERLKTDAAIKGAVITSGKASGFCAGADLGEMGQRTADDSRSAEVFAQLTERIEQQNPEQALGWITEQYQQLVGNCGEPDAAITPEAAPATE